MTSHEDAKLLIAPYALGIADADERAIVDGHLAECEACRSELQGFELVATGLAQSVEDVEPPAELRSMVMTAVGATPRDELPAPVVATDERPVVERPAAARARRAWFRNPVAIGVPALAVACLLLAVLSFGLNDRVGELEQQLDRSRLQAAGAAEVDPVTAMVSERVVPIETSHALAKAKVSVAVLDERSGAAVLVLHDLPAPPTAKAWQAWGIDAKGQRISVGTVDEGGRIVFMPVVAGKADKITAYALTLEPVGGSEQPTTEPQGYGTI